MATIHKLTKDGATIFPATITDAVVHPQTGKTLTSMMKDYNVSELFPTEGIDGGNKYTLALAIQVLGTHLSAAQKTGGIKLTFISSVSPYPEEEYYLGKSSWSATASDWDQRFEVGDVVADPSGSWEPSTAQQYIDSQIAGVNTNLASETIARQNGDNNLSSQLTSEMNTRASQDANLNALINAGIREGGGVEFDIVPTQNSANGITSGGMYNTLRDSNIGFVDEVPITGSNNLAKSGGIAGNVYINQGYAIRHNGDSLITTSVLYTTDFLPIDKTKDLKVYFGFSNIVSGTTPTDSTIVPYAFYDKNKNFVSAYDGVRTADFLYVCAANAIPANAEYVRCTYNSDYQGAVPMIEGLKFNMYDFWTDIDKSMKVYVTLPSCDVNTVLQNGTWVLDSENTYTNLPTGFTSGFIRVSRMNNVLFQELYTLSNEKFYKRRSLNGTFSNWVQVGIIYTLDSFMAGTLPDNTDANSVVTSGTWLLDSTFTYQNIPVAGAGFLRVTVTNASPTILMQEWFNFSDNRYYKRRRINNNFSNWVKINGNDVTINNDFNSYQQTVNLTSSPSITTDTNNYLASTGDNTDRTADILTMLQATGVCNLGPGVFYVGNLIMPDNTSLIGSGVATEIRLLSSVTDGFAVRIGSRCLVTKFKINGQDSISQTPEVGTRHGILWQGNATASGDNPFNSIVSDLIIQKLAGGGITCYDTGYGTQNFLDVSNVIIENCNVGINISYWSEFHKFTNVRAGFGWYGCINNGGNNVFVNCDFSRNSHNAFLIDNSQGQSINNSHGSCVGCVFNHTAEGSTANAGTGIKILGAGSGFIFSGCQIFFSKIEIDNSLGIVFSACNIGYNNCNISVNGGGTVLFVNNIHQDIPPSISITNNNKTHFVSCYNKTTGALIEP